jgi:tetratricopeptide (TPR) repeat protein
MKNKKIKILSTLILLSAALCGCSDFLDIKPKGRDVPELIEHFNGLFNENTLMSLEYPYFVYMTDELIVTEESFANMDQFSQRAYKWEANIFEDGSSTSEFHTMYKHIYTYNLIAENVMDAEDGTTEEKEALLAEARATRAYYYMMLAQWFGKPYNESTAAQDLCVPIVTEANSVATDFSRNTVKEVWDFIITELEESCPDLPEVTRHRLRVYQPAGYMFLGRAYWLMGRYADAVGAFQKAETALVDAEWTLELFDYNEKIAEWGYYDEMAMFLPPAAWGVMYGGYPYNFDENNTEVVFNKQIELIYTYAAMMPPTIFVKPEFMALYEEGDHRSKFFADTDFMGMTVYPYYTRNMMRSLTNLAADLPDFYLMYAECLARTGDLPGARTLVSILREHRIDPSFASIPSSVVSQDDLIRFIVEERTREFLMLGYRWFDMRRLWNDPLFQDMKASYTHTDGENNYTLTEDRLTYRIPPSVLKFNTSWTDNK